MRKILTYAEAKFEDEAIYYWKRTIDILETLPKQELEIGFEQKFSSWLSQSDCDRLRNATNDELSCHLPPSRRDRRILLGRRPSEEVISYALGSNLSPMTVSTLEDLASVAIDLPGQKIRKTRGFTDADHRGRRQEFVTPSEVPTALEEFCHIWNDTGNLNIEPKSIWLFVSLLNTHAFKDGNGRLARALLNVHLIRNGLLGGLPIPFGPLIYATEGNFELAMGRAAIMGNWTPMCRTCYVLIDFYSECISRFGVTAQNG